MTARIDFNDLPADLQQQLRKNGVRPKRERRGQFKLEDVRRYSIRVLAELDGLTQAQRDRVLRHALKVNEI